ncbi:hypothetical protein HAZT_HAZT011400, partial [Hyalella azteca]
MGKLQLNGWKPRTLSALAESIAQYPRQLKVAEDRNTSLAPVMPRSPCRSWRVSYLATFRIFAGVKQKLSYRKSNRSSVRYPYTGLHIAMGGEESLLHGVIVTPAVNPRLDEFLHFCIQSTGYKSRRVNTQQKPSRRVLISRIHHAIVTREVTLHGVTILPF